MIIHYSTPGLLIVFVRKSVVDHPTVYLDDEVEGQVGEGALGGLGLDRRAHVRVFVRCVAVIGALLGRRTLARRRVRLLAVLNQGTGYGKI